MPRETQGASLARASISRRRRDLAGKEGSKEGERRADFVTSSNSHSGVGTPTPARHDEIEWKKKEKTTKEEKGEEKEEEEEEKKKRTKKTAARVKEMKKTYHVNIGKADRVALLLVRLLGLPLRLVLEVALLQHYSVLRELLGQAVEAPVEPGDAVDLPAPIVFDSSSQAVHDRLPLGGDHLTHAGCLAHLLLLLLLLLLVLLLLLLLLLMLLLLQVLQLLLLTG